MKRSPRNRPRSSIGYDYLFTTLTVFYSIQILLLLFDTTRVFTRLIHCLCITTSESLFTITQMFHYFGILYGYSDFTGNYCIDSMSGFWMLSLQCGVSQSVLLELWLTCADTYLHISHSLGGDGGPFFDFFPTISLLATSTLSGSHPHHTGPHIQCDPVIEMYFYISHTRCEYNHALDSNRKCTRRTSRRHLGRQRRVWIRAMIQEADLANETRYNYD